jgi:anti-anti-sigma factor
MEIVRFEHEGGALVVVPSGPRLDAETAVEFSRIVAAQARGRTRVTVSLANVEAIDHSGLAALVVILKQLSPGGELRLRAVRPSVQGLLASTGLDAIFPVVEEDASEAAPSVEGIDAALAP